MWEKRTLWENAARVPLVIRAPWLHNSAGKRSQELVELVDVYRTVLDLANVSLPSNDTYPVEGVSLAPLLGAGEGEGEEGEGSGGRARWQSKVALTMYPRCPSDPKPGKDWVKDACIHTVERSEFAFMGYSMRADARFDGHSYRYTEYVAWNGSSLAPERPRRVHSAELYNHSAPCDRGTIFDCFENVNLVHRAPVGLLQELRDTLRRAYGV